MKKMNENRCAYCENCNKTYDHRNWVHYSCEYAPNIEFLKDFPVEPLNPTCGKFKPSYLYQVFKTLNDQERQEQEVKETAEIIENNPLVKYRSR